MSECWYCHFGWPEQVVSVYRKWLATAGLTAMHFGPGHIVWEDENFDTPSIKWCIEHAQKYRDDLTDDETSAVVESLVELLAVPEDVRCVVPEDYDGENPERFPPLSGSVMIKHKRDQL